MQKKSNLQQDSLFQDPVAAPHAGAARRVLVPYPVDKAYDYIIPAELSVQDGDYVTVPLGGREIAGVVWGTPEGKVAPEKLKAALARHDLPPMPAVQRQFIDWVAQYTMTPVGAVLKMALSVPKALEKDKAATGYRLPLPAGERAGVRGVDRHVTTNRPEDLIGRGRALRQNAAEAEKRLWYKLRNRQLDDLKFKRQHSLPPYIVDFICFEKNLIIEIDGGQHNAHKDYDEKRTAFLERQGYQVLRFWNNDVFENVEGVLQKIQEQASAASSRVFAPSQLSPPSPQPSPLRGEGVTAEVSPKYQKVLNVLKDGQILRASEIAELAGCGPGVVKTMAAKGYLETVEMHSVAPCRQPDFARAGADLSADQQAAAEALCAVVQERLCSTANSTLITTPPLTPTLSPAGRGSLDMVPLPGGERLGEGADKRHEETKKLTSRKPILLDGVTGAGKTEVYFEAVAAALQQDKQVLILLPEIALSNAFLDRFKSRFGCAPALWHSQLSPAQRRVTWRGVAEGQTKVIVGARSALFLPYADLGLIIVDEEHDPAFKQEEGVIYHARDMAIVRAHLGKIPIVLVSATPSVETIHNAWTGKYAHLHLPDRFGGATLPDIAVIDMRADKPESGRFIAPTLKNAMIETLGKGEQVLLFLNRRGYAPLTLCRTCGHRMECPRCTTWLVEHKQSNRLHCHHCGYHASIPAHCPECNDLHSFAACGPGVERILEEVTALFPDARTLVLASDTAESTDDLKKMLDDIRTHKVDIVIGTQIIAKGHHFPGLTLVGVVDADLGLRGGELRAAERTYQLLHQVAGRAGREQKKGRVYLQTWMPDSRIMQALAAAARDNFLSVELQEREVAHMPPFSRLAGIIVSGRDEKQVIEAARALGRSAPHGQGIQTLGPAPAPLARLRGKFRHRLLVRAAKTINIQRAVAEWTGAVKHPSNVRIQIDIDPQSFL